MRINLLTVTRTVMCALFLISAVGLPVFAQGAVPYAGAIGGIATLSADAGSQPAGQGLSLSAYSPSNGAAVNAFAGVHFHNYFSLQANYMWNENALVLSSNSSASDTFYEQARTSSQHAVVFDFLIYFRPRNRRIRPYLGTGGGAAHFASSQERVIRFGGTPALPPPGFSATSPIFRSHVGIDLRLSRLVDFRYSFSELIGANEISKHLAPPGSRRLANFQNLFGFLVRFRT